MRPIHERASGLSERGGAGGGDGGAAMAVAREKMKGIQWSRGVATVTGSSGRLSELKAEGRKKQTCSSKASTSKGINKRSKYCASEGGERLAWSGGESRKDNKLNLSQRVDARRLVLKPNNQGIYLKDSIKE